MKNGLFLLLLSQFIGQMIFAQNRATEIRNRLLNRDASAVMVIAHRGDWRNAPENSLPAISNAIAMGVDIVEIDLQRTKDGHIIVMHDKTLDRTTTGQGLVSDWNLDSIRTLKLKNGLAIKTKEHIPTLEEALSLAKGKIMLNLDKADPYFDDIYELAKKTGTTEQIIMKGSRSPKEVQEKFGKYLHEVIYMPIIDLDDSNALEHIKVFNKELHPVAFELLYKDDANPLPKEIAGGLLQGNALIWYNSLWDTLCGGHDDDMALDDPDGAYGYLINALGARMIQTDRPAYLINYLKEKQLHW